MARSQDFIRARIVFIDSFDAPGDPFGSPLRPEPGNPSFDGLLWGLHVLTFVVVDLNGAVMALVVRVSGRARSGCRERLFAAFAQHLAPRAEANPAQRLVIWSEAEGDAEGFELVEWYVDAAAADENARSEWFRAYLGEAMALVDGMPSMHRFTPRWVTGLGESPAG